MTVTDQRFNLNSAYEELKHRLDIWGERGSGWVVDKIKAIHIKYLIMTHYQVVVIFIYLQN